MTGITFAVSEKIKSKLLGKRPPVEVSEVTQCFYNRTRGFLEDDREKHRTDPPTQWFVGETDKGRKLKVVFILRDNEIQIKSAYDANEDVVRIYKNRAGVQ